MLDARTFSARVVASLDTVCASFSLYQNKEVEQAIQKTKLEVVKEHGPATCDTCTNPGCCYQQTYATLLEALPIALAIHKRGDNTQLLWNGLIREGEAMESTNRSEWFESGRHPCVFLKDNRCSVYRDRPLACRMYYAFTPQAYCMPEDNENPVLHFEMGGLLTDVMASSLRVQVAWRLGRERAFMASLPRMTGIVLEALAGPDTEFLEKLTKHEYPTLAGIPDWVLGDNPFAKRRNERQEGTL